MKDSLVALWFLAATFQSGLSFAADGISPPSWPVEDFDSAHLLRKPFRTLMMGQMSVVLGKTPLKDIRENLGIGKQFEGGDASESITWLCYTIPGNPAARLWLTSSEMYGGTIVDGFSAIELPETAQAVPACPELPKRFRSIALAGGIELGLSEKQLEARLPPYKQGISPKLFHYKLRKAESGIDIFLLVKMDRGHLAGISATYSESD